MPPAVLRWFEPSAFTPHGFCLLWEPGLIWLHGVSDGLIALAYFSIPLAIAAFLRRRPDVEYRWVGWLFAVFILACGATHVLAIVTLWQPFYWLEGGVKLATAVISVATAVLLWPLVPKLVALPSPAALREANIALESRVAERSALVAALERRKAELVELTATLEQRVAERTESLAATNRRFETALAASGMTVFTQDAALAYTYISKGEIGLTPEQFIGRTDAELVPDPPCAELYALKLRVLETGKAATGQFELGPQWFQLTAQPLPDRSGIICGAVDITRNKRDEARISFLLNEMKHRIGNVLAVAQAMLRQTAAGSTTVEDVTERLGLRLRALAKSQQLLLRPSDGSSPRLHEVVQSQMAPYSDAGRKAVTMAGPTVGLDASAIMHIGMALHELASNASKYGALSVPDGQVDIAWDLVEREVRLRWCEAGGPTVAPPQKEGFGRQVIEWAVARAVQGHVRMDFRPEGLVWELRFPVQS